MTDQVNGPLKIDKVQTAPSTSSNPKVNGDVHLTESDTDDENENEIVEESSCGRWSKRKEQIKQRDVPGIDFAYLAMDNEKGTEVVWNEVLFSERKNFKAQEAEINAVFGSLTRLVHPNLVTFHKFWLDAQHKPCRLIFITEYLSASKQTQNTIASNLSYLRTIARKGGPKMLAEDKWKRWCTQILSALCYLHSSDAQIIHGNLNCNTIFIQVNGLIKIGCVAPNTIHHHVKTVKENFKNMHYIAPEYGASTKAQSISTAVDIYAFGICALEMAVLGLDSQRATTSQANDRQPVNGSEKDLQSAALKDDDDEVKEAKPSSYITREQIKKVVDGLENPLMKEFIQSCLQEDPRKRPTARELLFHSVLFEVHSLKLLAAHTIVKNKIHDQLTPEQHESEASQSGHDNKDRIFAQYGNGHTVKVAELRNANFEIDKFLEDVENGIFPLWVFGQSTATKPAIATSMSESNRVARTTESDDLKCKSESKLAHSGSVPGQAGCRLSDMDRHDSPNLHTQTGAERQTSKDSSQKGTRPTSPSDADDQHDDDRQGSQTPSHVDGYTPESRRIMRISAELKVANDTNQKLTLTILLKLEDGMNRQLTSEVHEGDCGINLARDLVSNGFINELDQANVQKLLEDALWHRTGPDQLDET